MSANPSPALAALLSFLFPGLGQAYAGDVRKGLLWAIPMLLFIVAVLFLLLGGSAAITSLLTVQKTLALIVFDAAFFLYHIAAMLDAYDQAKRGRSLGYARRSSTFAPIALAGLVAVTMVIHGLPAVYAADYYNFLVAETQDNPDNVIPSFVPTSLPPITPPPSGGVITPAPSFDGTPEPPDETPTPVPSRDPNATVKPRVCPPAPDFSGWGMAADGRLNLMIVGSDSRSDEGAGAKSIRTDSMMLLTVDIASCKSALFSFPRNMEHNPFSRYPEWFHIPTEDGGEFQGYLLALWQQGARAAGCETEFECDGGWRALTYAIQQMAGVQVDGVVAVNLKGFVDIVENLPGNGVWIDIPEPLYDDDYFNSQQQKMLVDFQAGCQFLNAEETLAYARSRHQDSDYRRARRQQYVLQQIRKQLDPLSLLPHIPGLLQAARDNLFMTISDTDIPYLAQVASRVDADRLYRFDFAPNRLASLGSMQGMRDKVQNIFDEPEPEPENNNADPCPPR